MERKKAAIVPAGAMGTAFAVIAAEKNNPILYFRSESEAKYFEKFGENQKYLPGINLPRNVRGVDKLSSALDDADILIWATPSKYFGQMRERSRRHRKQGKDWIELSLIKGLQESSHHSTIQSILAVEPDRRPFVAVLSGPSFAKDIATKQPTKIDLAAYDLSLAERLKNLFQTDNFRINTTSDVVGVELGGALKNVMAIAVGMYDGLKTQEGKPIWAKELVLREYQWAKVADEKAEDERDEFMYQCIEETMDLGELLGAERKTFKGASGWGDLEASSTPKSRNWKAGYALGRGMKVGQVLENAPTTEGLQTTYEAICLARRVKYDAKILGTLGKVFYRGVEPRVAFEGLKIIA